MNSKENCENLIDEIPEFSKRTFKMFGKYNLKF